MKIRTHVKAGGLSSNHNETLIRDRAQAKANTRPQAPRQGLKVKTHVKAGGLGMNHNETLVRDTTRRHTAR